MTESLVEATAQERDNAQATDHPTLARAVVVGIGGSGIQTITRVRSAIQAERPDRAAVPEISFLGIDAVDLSKQWPALPPGSTLTKREFLNLTDEAFDAHDFVSKNLGHSADLARWWDPHYEAPRGQLTDGLKQNRMIGRLAFYRERRNLSSRLSSAIHSALSVESEHMQAGLAGQVGGRIRIFVVASAAGGTGSAGLLETVHQAHTAAFGLGLTADVCAFIYLPGVFEQAVRHSSQDMFSELDHQQANAFAFLRELDHFVGRPQDFAREFGDSRAPVVPPLKQVYLVDASIDGVGFLGRIEDSYAMTAEAIYQMLVTQAAVSHDAANGTNTDILLQSRDHWDKPRIYCGLSVVGVTYPGSTLRRHLKARYAHWLVREVMLERTENAALEAQEHPAAERLQSRLEELGASLGRAAAAEAANDLRRAGGAAEANLREDPSADVAGRVIRAIESGSLRLNDEADQRARILIQGLLREFDDAIGAAVAEAGLSLPMALEVLKHAVRWVESRADTSRERSDTATITLAKLSEETQVHNRRLAARRERWLRLPGSVENLATALGTNLERRAATAVDEVAGRMEHRFFSAAKVRLEERRAELERAELELSQVAAELEAVWTNDRLAEKDIGPVDTVAMIPSDIRPEVEACSLAVDAYRRVLKAVRADQTHADLNKSIHRDRDPRGPVDGILSLGSLSKDERSRARTALIAHIDTLATRHALEEHRQETDLGPDGQPVQLHLPRSLRAAAARIENGEDALERSVRSIAMTGNRPAWVIRPANMGTTQYHPSPSMTVSRPAELAEVVEAEVPTGAGWRTVDSPDPERIMIMVTEWGASAHAVAPVANWQPIYQAICADIPRNTAARRVHLRHDWPSGLTSLVPSYSDPHATAQRVVLLLAVGELLNDEAIGRALFGRRPLDCPAPLAQDKSGQHFVGTIYREDLELGIWVPREPTVSLGSDYVALLEEIGRQTAYALGSDALVEAAVAQAGRPEAIRLLRQLAERRFGEEAATAATTPGAQKAISDLHVAALDVAADLEELEIRGRDLADDRPA